MYTIMAEESNKYVQRRKQAREYFYFLNILFTKFSKNVKISHDFQEKSGFQKKSSFTYVYISNDLPWFKKFYKITSVFYH